MNKPIAAWWKWQPFMRAGIPVPSTWRTSWSLKKHVSDSENPDKLVFFSGEDTSSPRFIQHSGKLIQVLQDEEFLLASSQDLEQCMSWAHGGFNKHHQNSLFTSILVTRVYMYIFLTTFFTNQLSCCNMQGSYQISFYLHLYSARWQNPGVMISNIL